MSLKNNSKEYLNFELSELEEKKNSKENILIEPKDEEKLKKINELSNF